MTTATANGHTADKRPRKRAKADGGPTTVGKLVNEALEKAGKAPPTDGANEDAKPERPKRPRQKELPGMERPRIQELEDAAEELAEVRTERICLSGQEKQLAEKVAGLLKKHQLTQYKLDDEREVVSVPTEFKVKVRKIKEPKDPSKLPVKE